MPIRLLVNGTAHLLDTPPERPLLQVLREDLGLTGSKYGCGEGECGACTVLVNNEPVRSCRTRVAAVAGKSVTTIEALAQGGQLHPVQSAFLKHEAFQCGYCTAGMIMAAVGLLKRQPQPGPAEIERALDRNICRCGTYPRIAAALDELSRAGEKTT